MSVVVQPATAACVGDCDSNGTVTIDELVRGVNIALGVSEVATCTAMDRNSDGLVTIDELLTATNNALNGCPAEPTATNTIPPTPTATPTGTDTPATPSPSLTPSQTPGGPECGNRAIEPPETCDDGNTEDGDSCPSDCVIQSCTGDGTEQTVSVSFTVGAGDDVGSMTVLLLYPDGMVQIPGTGGQATVGARITNRPSGFLVDGVDLDYGMRVAIAGASELSPGEVFQVDFDHCVDAPDAMNTDFTCIVENAFNTSFEAVESVTCEVDVI